MSNNKQLMLVSLIYKLLSMLSSLDPGIMFKNLFCKTVFVLFVACKK